MLCRVQAVEAAGLCVSHSGIAEQRDVIRSNGPVGEATHLRVSYSGIAEQGDVIVTP